MKILKLTVAIVSLFSIACTSIAGEGVKPAYTKEFFIKGNSIRINVVVNRPKMETNLDSTLLWGTEFATPNNNIEKIDVYFSGERIKIPYSSYSDLVNIRNVSIDILNDSFSINVTGGDAATSYTATLLFSKIGMLQTRQVSSSEFPDVSWEKTEYSYNLSEN
ncbi:MAG: hypothetical protein MI867_04360 [Pseudomonadales bacterium]|nr:hypothetical protein [Pseudomonadales bacterium]